MNEVLFTEPAKHYLLSTELPNETFLIMVSPSEVNVLIRFAAPNVPTETNIIAQSTTIDASNFTVMLKQINRVSDMENHNEQELTKLFLKRLDNTLSLVQKRRINEEDEASLPVNNLRHGIEDLLKQV